MIASFTKAKFESGERLLQYGVNAMPEQGGTHIFMFNLAKHRLEKNGPEFAELGVQKGDIIWNSPAESGVE